jgi:hypothetical protein
VGGEPDGGALARCARGLFGRFGSAIPVGFFGTEGAGPLLFISVSKLSKNAPLLSCFLFFFLFLSFFDFSMIQIDKKGKGLGIVMQACSDGGFRIENLQARKYLKMKLFVLPPSKTFIYSCILCYMKDPSSSPRPHFSKQMMLYCFSFFFFFSFSVCFFCFFHYLTIFL